MRRLLIEIHGTVQGVGFRPFVYSRATALDLRGFAQNRGGHLFIDLEGEATALGKFVDELRLSPPPRAVIEEITCRPASPAYPARFRIAPSDSLVDDVHISPDLATCDRCIEELFDPGNRRYRYPFITCAHCGPRFTIATGIPYDRSRTTMSHFAMCALCRREYEDPADRRFHAQPIACADCGPVLMLHGGAADSARGDDALAAATAALLGGHIVAIKGLGGYHLACDATNADAVAVLRARKRRDAKPFAVMLTHEQADLLRGTPAIWALLNGTERPIVLIDRFLLPFTVADNVAAGCPALGVVLPYTPLHHLLMCGVGRPLVMTSGNVHDEPIAFDDDDARRRLAVVADMFLWHDRPIRARCDDSVLRAVAGGSSLIRRARGFAPAPLKLAEPAPAPILAVGGHLKNAFCVYAGVHGWLSSHVGDLESPAAYDALRSAVGQTLGMLDVYPSVVAHDRHPDYLSTRFAEESAAERRIPVQHHVAHVLSCAAEHGITAPVLGVALDGSGFGDDGTIWGGEFLLVDGAAYIRLAHLSCVPLPGGDAAIRQPWRMAVAHLAVAGHRRMLEVIEERIGRSRFSPVHQMVMRSVAAPLTSSAGRLFDAVAAIAGIRDEAAFEGQPAMELERLACGGPEPRYQFDLDTSTDRGA